MASIVLLLVFCAFYTLCNTSKKAILNSYFGFENWITNNKKAGKLLGVSVLVISCTLSCMRFGFGVGVFYFFIALMTTGSLVVILNPIKLLKPKPIIIVYAMSIVLEFLVFNQ